MATRGADTRARLLDSAELVVDRVGAARLTLEAIAEEAGVSKGGLLYHYASKDALIAAMLDRRFARFDETRHAHLAADRGVRGRKTRAYLHATAQEARPEAAAGLLAAVASNQSLLRPLQDRYAHWQADLEDDGGLSLEAATLLRLVADGLWLSELMGFAPPKGPLRDQVLALASRLSRPAPGEE